MNRTHVRAWTLLLMSFSLGAVTGVAGSAFYVYRVLRGIVTGPPTETVDRATLWALEADLGLDARQREQAAAILRRDGPELRQLHVTVAPRIMALRRREAAELRPHLRPEQQWRLDEHVVRIEDRVRQILELPPPPP